MNTLQDSLIGRNYNESQRLAFLASVGDESGGDPKSVDSTGEFKGIVQWGTDRYPGTENLGEQIHYMLNEAETLKDPGWNDGGKGIPTTPTAKFAYDSFWKSATPDSATLYLNKGYVRPREEHDRIRRAEQASIMNKYLEKKRRGGVIKYQNPSSGIQRRDAIKDYTPQVPFNKMKWINTPTQQPVLSQDNRSKWQHEQASKQADKGYNEYMEAKKAEQGLDRLNQFATFTDYAGLATGIGGLLGKGVKYAGKQAMKKRLLNAANSTSSAALTPKFSISKEVLPNYAKSNWQGDELALTKDRLANGGFDRLQALKGNQSKIAELQKRYGLNPRDYDYSYDDFSPEGRKALLEAQPRYGKAADFGTTPDIGGGTDRRSGYYTSLFDDAANRTPANIAATEAHEYSHFVFDPDKLPPMDAYDFNKIPERFRSYYMGTAKEQNRGMEITARGTQIKNYFGLKEGQPITEDMLKYAAENYVKDRGVDNGMNIFFGGIKDYKKMADWLTKWSPAIATPIIGNKMINDNDKIK